MCLCVSFPRFGDLLWLKARSFETETKGSRKNRKGAGKTDKVIYSGWLGAGGGPQNCTRRSLDRVPKVVSCLLAETRINQTHTTKSPQNPPLEKRVWARRVCQGGRAESKNPNEVQTRSNTPKHKPDQKTQATSLEKPDQKTQARPENTSHQGILKEVVFSHSFFFFLLFLPPLPLFSLPTW